MDCKNCEKNVPETVTRYFFEETVARMDIAHKRIWILCIVLAVLLAVSWGGFFVYESQFEDVSVSQDIDTGDGNAVVAGAGDVYYGESQTNGKN